MTKPPDQHLQAVAYLVEAITDGRWHRAGTMAALRDCDGPLWLIAHAAIIAAHTRTDQTSPAVIAMVGAHWDDPTAKPATTTDRSHDLPRWRDDLAYAKKADPATVARYAEKVRQAARTAHTPTTDDRPRKEPQP